MKINEFEKLEEKLNGQNFHESYKTINKVMIALSYFGHIASIFLAFFMLSGILMGVMENKAIVYVVSIIILSAIELLKRDIFNKFSILYLKLKSFTKDVLPLFFLSLIIIGISFYTSINGAAEYSSKSEKIEQESSVQVSYYSDSVSKVYNDKIKTIEIDISKFDETLSQKTEQENKLNELVLNGTITWQQRKLIQELKTQKEGIKTIINEKNDNINSLKNELSGKIEDYENDSNTETNKKKDDNSKNSIAFIIFSTIIEIAILAGVYFKDYYDVRSYREKKDKIERDPGYQRWKLYNQILEIIYTEDTKMNEKLPSSKNIIDMCKRNDIIVLPKDITDFLKVMVGMGIIKVSGSTRYVIKQRELSFESLKKQFNIE